MQKVLLVLMLVIPLQSFATETFFPPDIVPHPNPPWDQPSGPGEPEMA